MTTTPTDRLHWQEQEQRRRLPETIIYVDRLRCGPEACPVNHRWSWISDEVVICRHCETIGNVVTYDDRP